MTEQSYFRGYNSIREIVNYMQPLADWMSKHKPDTKVLTLKGPDFDLLKRWPKAASILEVTQNDVGELSYHGFALKRDRKPPRYPKRGTA